MVEVGTERGLEQFVVTWNHPFWAEGKGWVAAEYLEPGDYCDRNDGEIAVVVQHPTYIFRTTTEQVGYSTTNWEHEGRIIDMRNKSLSFSEETMDVDIHESTDHLNITVYNIEVSDFPAYFVGNSGIWVHTGNCRGLGVTPVNE